MQIINAYTDGKYYIASNIERIDNKGKFISLEAPRQDILTLCLEFSTDLMLEVEKSLTNTAKAFRLKAM
ncbi:hypothetical protein HSBAA_51700 [Vreelandella sulfidaeris]|uniref:Uncharacterized protein n=1 Tax=Vreelandella sulfidaeris TaxID=115553 RepID=A0A455ULP9_9GAMM|nr:hypothetical protein HSBAA_51700 [Halomonas sulfidaeris]